MPSTREILEDIKNAGARMGRYVAGLSVAVFTFTALVGAASAGSIGRSEVLSIAAAFAEHRWKAAERNILHGLDGDKIEVHTPNSPARAGSNGGLWKIGDNVGVPYKWGGFDSLESFDRGVRKGRAAGDLYSAEKRRKGGRAVSGDAVGLDCSGFISRCWKLAKKKDTHSLASICRVLPGIEALRPGDVLNQAGGHVVLFVKWSDETRTRAVFYEAEPYSKVVRSERDVPALVASGFQPLRYRQIRD